MTTFHIDKDGNLLKATSDPDAQVPGAVTKTEIPPDSGRQKWTGNGWGTAPAKNIPAALQDSAGPPTTKDLNDLRAFLRERLL